MSRWLDPLWIVMLAIFLDFHEGEIQYYNSFIIIKVKF